MRKPDKRYYFKTTLEERKKLKEMLRNGELTTDKRDYEDNEDWVVLSGYTGELITYKSESSCSHSCGIETTIDEFVLKFGTRSEIKEWFRERTKNFYPNWESLAPLPNKPRPWAKEGERYVSITEFGNTNKGDILSLKTPDDSTEPWFHRGPSPIVYDWRWLAKIPGETYTEEPEITFSVSPEQSPGGITAGEFLKSQPETPLRVTPNKLISERQEFPQPKKRKSNALPDCSI